MSEALPILGTDKRVSKKVNITLGTGDGNPYSLETFITERAKQYQYQLLISIYQAFADECLLNCKLSSS